MKAAKYSMWGQAYGRARPRACQYVSSRASASRFRAHTETGCHVSCVALRQCPVPSASPICLQLLSPFSVTLKSISGKQALSILPSGDSRKKTAHMLRSWLGSSQKTLCCERQCSLLPPMTLR
jgi:hypothetical protein